jgi:ferredoxin-NADP reductase
MLNTATKKTPFFSKLNLFNNYLDLILCDIDPIFSQQRIGAEIVKIIQETKDTTTLVLKANIRWKGFLPGQYISIELDINGVRMQRNYSISSSPQLFKDKGIFSITVKSIAGGKVSAYINQHTQTKDVIYISDAKGDFTLSPFKFKSELDATLTPLFIAAGSGITPIMSMIENLLDSQYERDISLVYYVNTPEDVIFEDRLSRLAGSFPQFHFIPHFSDQEGFITKDVLENDCSGDLCNKQVFICGPQVFMDSVQSIAKNCGIEQDSIQLEQFGSATNTSFKSEKSGQVKFERSGKSIPSNGDKSLLELAELAGLAPKYGCRSGICCECKCQRPEGTLLHKQTGQLIPEDQSHIQTCISMPVGDVSLHHL